MLFSWLVECQLFKICNFFVISFFILNKSSYPILCVYFFFCMSFSHEISPTFPLLSDMYKLQAHTLPGSVLPSFQAGCWYIVDQNSHSFNEFSTCLLGLPWWLSGKEPTCQCRRHRFDPWVREITWRKK